MQDVLFATSHGYVLFADPLNIDCKELEWWGQGRAGDWAVGIGDWVRRECDLCGSQASLKLVYGCNWILGLDECGNWLAVKRIKRLQNGYCARDRARLRI